MHPTELLLGAHPAVSIQVTVAAVSSIVSHDPNRKAARHPKAVGAPGQLKAKGQSRASRFAPTAELGEQRPQRPGWVGPGLQASAAFLVIAAVLLLLRTSPEAALRRLIELPAELALPAMPDPLIAALAALLIVTVGAGYRPLGGLLGFGALPLPALALATNSVFAAVICFAGTILSAATIRRLSKRDPQAPRDRRSRHRVFADAAHAAIATLIAAPIWTLWAATSPTLAIALSTLAWVLASQFLDRRQRRARAAVAQHSSQPLNRFGALWDALGWLLAASLALISTSVGPTAMVPALIGYLALIFVGTSRELDRTLHLRRIRDLQHLGSMAQRLVPREEASELASQCLEEVRRTVGFSHFELRFESSDGSEVFHSRARGPLLIGTETVPEHPAPTPGIHARREWILIERDLLSRPATMKESRADSLPEPPQRLGTLRLWIDPRNQADDDEALIDDLVPQIAALIDHSRLDREARIDALTGLARRQVFDRELLRRFELARDEGHSVALLLFDLDHFKQINDGYGHDAGDRVLEAIGAILLRAAEPGGLACRWGGEELALLIWGGGTNALVFAEELRRFIAGQVVVTDDGPLSVTTSVGVSAFPDLLIQDPDELVKLADEALYAAKERGRNRALLACGRGRFKGPGGELVGSVDALDPELIPQL